MRGIASQFVVSSLLSGESKLGESSKTTLFLLTSVWVFMSWDCRRLHTSNAPISSAIRTTPTTSTLTRTYQSHPRPLSLVVTRKVNRMILLYGDKFGHWLIKDLATWTTRERGIDRQTWNHDWNIGRTLRRGLFRHARLSICFKVQRMIRRFIGVLKLGLGSINLGRMTSEFLPLEISEPTTWEVTSARVQKHSLSTMLSKRADNDSFSNSNALALNSNHSIHSFKVSMSVRCRLMSGHNIFKSFF